MDYTKETYSYYCILVLVFVFTPCGCVVACPGVHLPKTSSPNTAQEEAFLHLNFPTSSSGSDISSLKILPRIFFTSPKVDLHQRYSDQDEDVVLADVFVPKEWTA